MREKRIVSPGPVLDEKGRISPGYSTAAISTFRRQDIQAPAVRIKEWDWYQVCDAEYCLQFTYGHASYIGQVGIMFFNFRRGEMLMDLSRLIPLPFGRMHLEENAEADSDLIYDKKDFYMRLKTEQSRRTLLFSSPDFEAEVSLERENPHSLVIHIPFDEDPKAFYYNQKINCMRARGLVTCQGKKYAFSDNAWGLLDWGRGVWPYHNEWYWSNGTGLADGQVFGFNLGTGFGNTSQATENCLFYGKSFYKLGRVSFEMDPEDPMQPWHMKDEEGRLAMTLTPSYDRLTKTKVLWIDNCTHQMFGSFDGRVVLEEGKELNIRGLPAFAEHAVNNW